jgi:F0F1-type ATP synthase assembly protein I
MGEVLTGREKAILIGLLVASGFVSSCLVGFGVGFMLGKLAA